VQILSILINHHLVDKGVCNGFDSADSTGLSGRPGPSVKISTVTCYNPFFCVKICANFERFNYSFYANELRRKKLKFIGFV